MSGERPMMRTALRVVLTLLLVAPLAHAAPDAFRIGYIAPASSACRAPDATATTEMRAYVDHLSRRLGRPILVCAFASAKEASMALAGGQVDFGPFDSGIGAQDLARIRPLLAPRAAGGVGRVLTVLASKAQSPFDVLSKAAGARVVLGGTSEVARTGPLQALADHGITMQSFKAEIVAPSPEAAVALLRSGKADFLLTYAAAWQRLCRGDGPNQAPCADLHEVWRGRPDVDTAFAVRRDLPDEERLRLVGIHVALNLEAPEAFRWIAPGAGELQPVEARARTRSRGGK